MTIEKYNEHYFYLHKWCKPVKGHLRSSIADLERAKIKLIPNELFDMLATYHGKKIKTIVEEYAAVENSLEVINEYFEFLIEEEFIFLSPEEEKELLTEENLNYEKPYRITNGIIDHNQQSQFSFKKIIDELQVLGCRSLQLRFYDAISLEKLIEILNLTNTSIFRQVEIVIKYVDEDYLKNLKTLLDNHRRILNITLHSMPEEKPSEHETKRQYVYTKEKIDSCLSCGQIAPFFFDFYTSNYLIGKTHNTCLYKKIAVDVNGNIKNCPSMTEHFGNIETCSLAEALEKEGIKKYWDITKEQINVCKDCEFRLVCTDCRAYMDENEFEKPKKCHYDPYTAKWAI
jgi:SPASM domain peptide maturase of grasp-with-spasm system